MLILSVLFFFFKQKTAYEMRISDWSSDVCASDLDDLPGWAAFLHPASSDQEIAVWIVVTCAVVMALGTASGGWKIIKTMGHKMVKLHPIHGFAAETSSATILTLAAHFGMPVSTTHSISTAIM